MSFAGLLALCISHLAVLVLAVVLPFVTADLRENERRKLPWWCLLAGFAGFFCALAALSRPRSDTPDIPTATVDATALVLGACLKWLLDIAARKPPQLHGATLARGLLVAPLVPLLWGSAFDLSLTPQSLCLWFGNGFFWQTVIGDFERMFEPEHVIVRRLEPAFSPAPPTDESRVPNPALTELPPPHLQR